MLFVFLFDGETIFVNVIVEKKKVKLIFQFTRVKVSNQNFWIWNQRRKENQTIEKIKSYEFDLDIYMTCI